MSCFRPAASLLAPIVFVFVLAFGAGASLKAQSSGMEMHANGSATAADIGLPAYPGATLYKEPGSDSNSVDMELSFGDFHFRIVAASYLSSATPAQLLDFYRKPLARFGEVLECHHGKPVGALKSTQSGLTCSDSDHDNHLQVNGDSSDDHELRAGNPQKFRIVGIHDHEGPSTRFGLGLVELPKDDKK